MTGLLSEFASAADNVRQPHLDRLRGFGVSTSWPSFGVARCEAVGGGLYQPLPGGGMPHLILPVVEDGALVDLVAFRTSDPGGWLLRTGLGWALGMEAGIGRWLWHSPADPTASPPRHQVGQPAHIFSDPLDWLRGSGDGICVLDWEAPEVRSLDVLREVVCSTPAVAELLARALMRPAWLPKISLMEARNVA